MIFVCGVLVTKEKGVHTALCTTYVEKKTTKNTLNITFLGENVLVPLYGCMLSYVEIQHWSYFQDNLEIGVSNRRCCMPFTSYIIVVLYCNVRLTSVDHP
jgi:hypothetical protein